MNLRLVVVAHYSTWWPSPTESSLGPPTLKVWPVTPFIPGWGDICSVAIGQRVTLSRLPPLDHLLLLKSSTLFHPCLKAWRVPWVPSTPCHRRIDWACSLFKHAGCDFHRYGLSRAISQMPRMDSGKNHLHSHLFLKCPKVLVERGAQSRHPAAFSHYFPVSPHSPPIEGRWGRPSLFFFWLNGTLLWIMSSFPGWRPPSVE